MEGETSTEFKVNDGRGTQQGAVISPLLFNIAMIPLFRRLQEIRGLHHTVYADDITIWTSLPSPHMGNAIKAGVEVVKEEAKNMGLECAAEKSALLIGSPQNRKHKGDMEFYLQLQNTDILRVNQTRVLRLEITISSRQCDAIRSIRQKADSAARLIRRVSRRNYGLTENGTCRVVQAFTLRRIMHAAPYMNLSRTSKDAIDATIRKSFKTALCIPQTTSTEVLGQFGIHNGVKK